MRRRLSVGEDEAAVDLTPMLDIVFIMLIFFIVTATFVRERGLEVFNPGDCTAQADGCGKGPPPIMIYVSKTDEIQVPDARVGGLRTISRNAVRANVERARVELPQSPVLIQAQPEADMGVVISVLDQARQAGAPGVTIATVE